MTPRRGWQWVKKKRYARVRVGSAGRESIPLSGCRSDVEANERVRIIRKLARELVGLGMPYRVKDFAEKIGAATTQREIDVALKGAALVGTTGEAPEAETFEEFAAMWTTGQLHELYPTHVKKKRSAADDAGILKLWVNPVMGKTAIGAEERLLEDAERVMRALPRDMSPARMRHVAQVIHRVLALAVYPAKKLARMPLPKGFLPLVGKSKAKSFLYPSEDAKLMAYTEAPIEDRVFFGMLDREGFRSAEFIGGDEKGRHTDPLAWSDVDLDNETITLDENKTEHARSWKMAPGVAAALRAWKEMRGKKAGKYILTEEDVPARRAERLRAYLMACGVDRAALHEESERRMRLRVHDLRGTFVTLSLADGESESFVMDRTGHMSSNMINRYRQSARHAKELGLGRPAPLCDAIPEIAAHIRKHGQTQLNGTSRTTGKHRANPKATSGRGRARSQ